MKLLAIFVVAGLLVSPAPGQEPDWTGARVVEVTLSSFDFSPDIIHLKSGLPIVLHLVNTGRGSHNFSAPEFFEASSVRQQDRFQLRKGAVEVKGRTSRDVWLIPRAGNYQLRCTHTLHSAFGMRGQILVE